MLLFLFKEKKKGNYKLQGKQKAKTRYKYQAKKMWQMIDYRNNFLFDPDV